MVKSEEFRQKNETKGMRPTGELNGLNELIGLIGLNESRDRVSYGVRGGRSKSGSLSCCMIIAEDAAVVVLVMVFGAEDPATQQRKNFSGEQHGHEWNSEIYPESAPKTWEDGAAQCSSWIHAHPGEG